MIKEWKHKNRSIQLFEDHLLQKTIWRNGQKTETKYSFEDFIFRPYPLAWDLETQFEISAEVGKQGLENGSESVHFLENLSLIKQASQLTVFFETLASEDRKTQIYLLSNKGIKFQNSSKKVSHFQSIHSLFFAGPNLVRLPLNEQKSLSAFLGQVLPNSDPNLRFPFLDSDIIEQQKWDYKWKKGNEYSYLKNNNGGIEFGGGNTAERYSGGAKSICLNFIRYYGKGNLRLQTSEKFLPYFDSIHYKITQASVAGNRICLDP